MGKVLPEYLSKWTTEKVAEEGVKVLTNGKNNLFIALSIIESKEFINC